MKGHHRVVRGSKHADHMKLGKANNRAFAGGGNDTVLGGAGDDVINARGDGGDQETGEDPGEHGDDDDGCEHVMRPGGPRACDSHNDGCDEPVEIEPEPDDPVELPEAGSEKVF